MSSVETTKKLKKKKKSKKQPKEVAAEVIPLPAKKKKKKSKKEKAVAVEVPAPKKAKKSKKKKKEAKKEAAPAPVQKAKKAKKAKKRKKEASAPVTDVTPPAVKKVKTSNDGKPGYLNYIEHPAVTAMTDAEVKAIRDEKDITVENWSMKPMTNFNQTGIPAKDQGYVAQFQVPSPIQSEAWAPLLCGRDVIGIAQTGSGKTLGFGLPAIPMITHFNKVNRQKAVLMLTLSPTRELAQQTDVVLTNLFKFINVTTVCIYGGGDKREQIRKLKQGAQAITATPGRLKAMLNEGYVRCDQVQYLVLDEADRMLDLGFEPDIRAILSFVTRPNRQTLLFSATWPKSIQKLASEFVNDPVHITVGNVDALTSNKNVTQIVEVCEPRSRQGKLIGLLHKYHKSKANRVLVFVLYKKEVTQIERFLKNKGFKCAGISSDYRQSDRERAIADFKSGSCPLLIATDVAARGLDIKNVEFVINYSFPLTVEDYIHRIGRTGRGGAKGLAHTFFTSDNKTLAGELVNVLEDAKTNVPDALRAFGCFTKKKTHSMYGDFAGRSSNKPMPKRKKVTF